MNYLKDISGITVIEQKNAFVVTANDGFCIKAIYKPKSASHQFDWKFIEEGDAFMPKRPEHFTLRHVIHNRLNDKKIKRRPVWKKGLEE